MGYDVAGHSECKDYRMEGQDRQMIEIRVGFAGIHR
jgi:hypothetical protein